MNLTDMMSKMRALYHFIKRQQKHREAFGVHPIRAVLIETTDEPRARKLMELVQHPMVIGKRKRSALFWFTISPLFTNRQTGETMPTYQVRPELVLGQIWA